MARITTTQLAERIAQLEAEVIRLGQLARNDPRTQRIAGRAAAAAALCAKLGVKSVSAQQLEAYLNEGR